MLILETKKPPMEIFFRSGVLFGWQMVGQSGLEPPTSRLSGVRSNHLSYWPITEKMSQMKADPKDF